MGNGGNIVFEAHDPGDFLGTPEDEAALQPGTVNRHRTGLVHAVIAVHVAQVPQVHGVLGGFLGMSREPGTPEFQVAPVVTGWRRIGQVPLGRASAMAPPGEDQAQDFPGFEHLQSGGPRRRRERGRHALAGDIILVPVKGAHEAAVAHPPAGLGAEIGTQVRTDRPGHADVALPIAPDNDLFAKPGFLEQHLFLDPLAAGDEIPALRKWVKHGCCPVITWRCIHLQWCIPGLMTAVSATGLSA